MSKPSLIFTDFDDTLTHQGILPSIVVYTIEKLNALGVTVIPVTGACAGWCDCLARILPIQSMIGENGAFYIEKTAQQLIYHDSTELSIRQKNKEKIRLFAEQIYQKYPILKPALDNSYRRYDYAIDFNQQVSGVSDEIIFDVRYLAEKSGITASMSSVHINLWIGEYNKLSGILAWLEQNRNLNPREIQKECVYIGDSPNDELVFSYLEQGIGVANIRKFLPTMAHKPQIITQKEGGFGFVEWVEQVYFGK